MNGCTIGWEKDLYLEVPRSREVGWEHVSLRRMGLSAARGEKAGRGRTEPSLRRLPCSGGRAAGSPATTSA